MEEEQSLALFVANHGLNPYYNGRYSWRDTDYVNPFSEKGLNPYYNGRYSWS